MALYREHVGSALPLHGQVWCQFAFNGGMTQEQLDARVRILPVYDTLWQGRKNVADQFAYRYNCDARTAVATVVRSTAASGSPCSHPATSGSSSFHKPEFRGLPASALVSPGELLKVMRPTIAA